MTTLLGDARVRIRPDFTGFQRESEQHISRVGPALGAAIKGTIVAAGAGIAAAGVVGLKTAAQMEQAKIGFTTMLGSAQKADKFLRQLSDFAAKTPFEFPELQTAASSLISVGVSADKVIPIMTTLGNITSGMGTGAEGIQRATVALQQMNAAGKISAEDLNQLRDAGIPVYELLAKATGKSKAEIVQMAQAGKLGRTELDKLMSLLESGKGLERFNGLMEKQSQSLSGLASTFKDTFSVGLAKALEPVIPQLKQGLTGAINAVGFALPYVSTGLSNLVSGLQTVYNAVKPAVQAFAPLVAQFTGAWIQNARGSFDSLVAAVKPLQEPLREVGAAFLTFAKAILPVLIENGRKVAAVVQPAFASIAKVIGEQVLPAIRDFLPAVTPVVKFLLNTFGDVLVGVLKGAVNVIEGVFRVIAGILNVFTGIFTGNWKKVWEGVKQIFGGAIQAILGGIQIWLFVGLPRLMLKGAALAFGLFKGAVVAGFNLSKAIFFGAPKFLSDGLLTLGSKLVGLGKSALAWFGREVQKGFNTLVGWIGKIPGRIADAFSSLGSLIVRSARAGINSVILWINDSLIDKLNALTGLFGLHIPRIGLSYSSGSSTPTGRRLNGVRAVATGGVMPGYTPGRDVHLAALSGGEAVMRPEWTRAVGVDRINAMNKAARMGGISGVQEFLANGGQHYALGGVFSSIWGGLKNVGGKAVDVVSQLGRNTVSQIARNILTPLVNGFANTVGNRTGFMGKLFTGVLRRLIEKVADWGKKQDTGGYGAPGSYGSGVKQWIPQVLQALKMLGQPASWLNTVLSRMNRESGGNPRAINLWDSNAKAGYPSQGLMQTIPGTFAAYAGALRGRGIYDPLANIYAGLNYAIHRYGTLAALNRPGGYARGTNNASRGWHLVGENGPELMRFKGGEQVLPNGSGGTIELHVHVGDDEFVGLIDTRIDRANAVLANQLRRRRR